MLKVLAASTSTTILYLIMITSLKVARVFPLLTRPLFAQHHPRLRDPLLLRSISSTSALSGSRRDSRKREKALTDSHTTTSSTADLNWETFDFSHSPKWDRRFDGDDSVSTNSNVIHLPSSQDSDLKELHASEEKADIQLREEFEKRHKLWESLDAELIQKATDVLLPFVQEERRERIQSVLKKRTRQTRFLFENPANPSNVWACLRTLDSFGIQHVDVVIQSGQYQGKAALSQKRGMRVAMGSAKWLTLKNHLTTQSALERIKREGYHIVATDVNPQSKDIFDMWAGMHLASQFASSWEMKKEVSVKR
jgi:SpoU rRNA Methylase family